MLNGGPVSWTSKTMPIVTISTAEAEFVAASRATEDIMYLRNVFRDLGIPIRGPTTLFSDNQAMIAFSETDSQPSRMKHIDLRRFFVRDYVMRGHVSLQYVMRGHASLQYIRRRKTVQICSPRHFLVQFSKDIAT